MKNPNKNRKYVSPIGLSAAPAVDAPAVDAPAVDAPEYIGNQNAKVVAELLDASKGFKGALGHVSQAAKLASAEFSKDDKLTKLQRVDAVIATYAPTFALCDSNVKKHFANCLWLLIAPDAKLEITPPKGKASAVTMKASEVVDTASKATIQKLAMEARAANGAGRTVTPRPDKKPASFFELLVAALKDKDQLIKIKLTLAAAGYALTPIAKLNKAQKVELTHIVPMANKITDVAQAGATN